MRRGALVLKMMGGVMVGLFCAAALAQDAGRDAANEPGQKAAESRQAAPGKQPKGKEDGAKPRRPSPEAVMRAFQRQRPTNAPVRSKATQSPTARGEPSTGTGSGARGLLREGQYINGVAGRLEREGPWWTFVFESDSPDTPRPPMRLLPNQKLENMTHAQEASTMSIVFEVSGELTLFASENYLLVRKSLRRRNADNLRK